MAQLTLYLPDALEKELRRAARKAKKSLSAYVAELAEKRIKPGTWPKSFAGTYGSWKGKFPEIERLPSERREDL
jgi:hypothetical protein